MVKYLQKGVKQQNTKSQGIKGLTSKWFYENNNIIFEYIIT
jgi:hypothetical protein